MLIDLTNKRFGRLEVIRSAGYRERDSGYRVYLWECKCDCGNTIVTSGHNLRSGDTRSCGCLKDELTAKRMYRHGGKHTRLYNIWMAMRKRCENPNDSAYSHYGGRGISVCDEWQEYMPFKEWAEASGYNDSLSIDRIDVNSNYCPTNCRWVTMKEQANNRTNSKFYEFNNEVHTIAQWADIYNIKYTTLYNRLMRGWPMCDAIKAPSIN